MIILARYELARHFAHIDGPALLLEGSWPADHGSLCCEALDDAIDARMDWIDSEAARLAEVASGRADLSPQELEREPARLLAYLNALKLRYWFVKMLRPVAYFSEIAPTRDIVCLELIVSRREDEDYVGLFQQICRRHAWRLDVRWTVESRNDLTSRRRRASLLRRITGRSQQHWATRPARIDPSGPIDRTPKRIVLCGNPHLLDPVCLALSKRGAAVRWLNEQFAYRTFGKWAWRGGHQLLCDRCDGPNDRFRNVEAFERLESGGVDLAAAASSFLVRCAKQNGARQDALLGAVERNLRQFEPQCVVLDQDATPMARAVVHVARRLGVTTRVVQHGVPCVRFGFASLAADAILAWNGASRRQFVDWGVDPGRIAITGSPKFDGLARQFEKRRKRSGAKRVPRAGRRLFLVLDNVLPRDDRPDAVSFRLTRSTHAAMLEMICRAVSRVSGSQLIVKLHPRSQDESAWRETLTRFPSVDARLIRRGDFAHWVPKASCVLSCASSAGMEAAWDGVPVVQILPPGSGNILPAEDWGLLGSARRQSELDALIAEALIAGHCVDDPSAKRLLRSGAKTAADRIAENLLANRPSHGPVRHVAVGTPRGDKQRTEGQCRRVDPLTVGSIAED